MTRDPSHRPGNVPASERPAGAAGGGVDVGPDYAFGAEIDADSGGQSLRSWGPLRIWAKITGASGAGTGGAACYPWQEATYDGTAWNVVAGGRSGDLTANSLKERNGNAAIASGFVVEAEPHESGLYWLFNAEAGAAGATTITVQGEGGTPSYAGIDTVRFEDGGGATVAVTNPVAGRANVTISSSLRVRELDGSPDVANVNDVVLDQSTGLTLTDLGGGSAGLAIVASSASWALTVRGSTGVPTVFPATLIETYDPSGIFVQQLGPGYARLRLQAPLPPEVAGVDKEKRYFRKDGRWYFGGEPHSNAYGFFGAVPAQPNNWTYFAAPLLVTARRAVSGIACWPTALGAPGSGARITLGVYRNGSEGTLYPGALELDAGDIDCDGTAPNVPELKVIPVNHALDAGLYWLVMVADDDAPFSLRVKVVNRDNCFNVLGNNDAWTGAVGGGSADGAQCGWVYNAPAFPAGLPAAFPGPQASPYLTQVGAVADHVPAIGIQFGGGEPMLTTPVGGAARAGGNLAEQVLQPVVIANRGPRGRGR